MLSEKVNVEKQNLHPVIPIKIGGVQLSAVIDSGSPLSIISDTAFQKCNKNISCLILPMQRTTIQGAIAGKSLQIKQQTYLDFTCQDHTFSAHFLIVPTLSTEMILGTDFLQKYKAILDFNNCEISMQHEGKSVVIKFQDWISCKEEQFNCFCLHTDALPQFLDVPYDSPLFNNRMISSLDNEQNVNLNNLIQTKVNQVTQCSDNERQQLQSILKTHATVFIPQPGTIKDFQYKFQVKEHTPFCVRPYPIPALFKDQVKLEIQKMLQDGVIEPAISPYNNPLHIVRKSNNSLRLVLDSRQLNTIIIPETDRPQTLDELLQNFFGVQVLSSVDLRSSFWQIELHPECRKYTAFLCFGVSYQFCKLPYGLNVSSAAFIRALNTILPDHLKKHITTYVDDILIAEKSWTDHNTVLGELLNIFRQYGITINLEKSKFGQSKIKFLGHIISAEGIQPDPEKLDAIRLFPTPMCKKQVRGFLGLINFYRRFIKIESLATPTLNTLTGKNTKWFWNDQANTEFISLKQALLQAPILSHPDMQHDFSLQTDSSKIGIGAHLFQEIEENGIVEIKTIAFTSRVLTKSEQNYGITELETLSVVNAFAKFRYFLAGKHTKVYTDHKALEFLMTSKLIHDRLKRWALYLQEYRFTVIHIPGTANIVADVLSRAPIGFVNIPTNQQLEHNFSLLYIKSVQFENFVSCALLDIGQLQDRDIVWKDIKNKWKDRANTAIRHYYLVRNNILFKRSTVEENLWLVCVPEEMVNKLIWYTHLSYAHFGPRKIFLQLRLTCYFNNMEKRIHKVLSYCKICQKAKTTTVSHKAQLYPIIPTKLKDLAAVDLLGPLVRSKNGFSYLFVAVELTSKFVSFTPLRRATARTVSAAFVKYFLKEVGNVQRVISDNGPQFRSGMWTRMLQRRKIKPIFISRYWPAANPAERIMKEINKLCRIYCHRQHRNWDKYISVFQDVLNELPHNSTSLPPLLVLKNKSPPNRITDLIHLPQTRRPRHQQIVQLALKKIQLAAEQRKKQHRTSGITKDLQVGQKVLIKAHPKSHKHKHLTAKFALVYNGPYRIKRIAHSNSYEIETIKTKKSLGLHHISHIKKFIE